MYFNSPFFQVKRQKLVTPDVHAAMQELEEEADVSENFHPVQPRVPYVQIDTFTSFLENIDNIEVIHYFCYVKVRNIAGLKSQ